jgi:hypothetical protein
LIAFFLFRTLLSYTRQQYWGGECAVVSPWSAVLA